MSVAVNTSTPFLPITSLQLQHLQAVTHSFAQRRSTISSVFNNFRTLSVATGVVPAPVRFFVGFRAQGFRSPLFSCCCELVFFSPPSSLPGVSGSLTFPFHANERAIVPTFFRRKKTNAKSLHGAVPIQCCISPFNARKHHSEKGLEPYRQLR